MSLTRNNSLEFKMMKGLAKSVASGVPSQERKYRIVTDIEPLEPDLIDTVVALARFIQVFKSVTLIMLN